MLKLTLLPVEKIVEVEAGETILDAALRSGVPIQHACGGFCACTTCHVLVEGGSAGLDALSEMEEEEADRLERVSGGMQANSRLACQSKVQSDVTVRIVNLEAH